jgi:hypothetical protein
MQQLVTILRLKGNGRVDADPETVIELTIAQHFATLALTKSLTQ